VRGTLSGRSRRRRPGAQRVYREPSAVSLWAYRVLLLGLLEAWVLVTAVLTLVEWPPA
jgi:hypothetical protein